MLISNSYKVAEPDLKNTIESLLVGPMLSQGFTKPY